MSKPATRQSVYDNNRTVIQSYLKEKKQSNSEMTTKLALKEKKEEVWLRLRLSVFTQLCAQTDFL